MPNPSKMLKAKPPVEFTPERKMTYLKHLRESGLVYLSAEMAGVTSWTVQDHRRRDPEFNLLCEEAKQNWVDEVLVKEAVRRATKGVSKPIIGGKERDQIVAYERVFSDGLMTTLLKASRSEFREGQQAGGESGKSASIMFIPAVVPTNMDEWEANYSEAAKGQGGRE